MSTLYNNDVRACQGHIINERTEFHLELVTLLNVVSDSLQSLSEVILQRGHRQSSNVVSVSSLGEQNLAHNLLVEDGSLAPNLSFLILELLVLFFDLLNILYGICLLPQQSGLQVLVH